jgi:hypothetical protein
MFSSIGSSQRLHRIAISFALINRTAETLRTERMLRVVNTPWGATANSALRGAQPLQTSHFAE